MDPNIFDGTATLFLQVCVVASIVFLAMAVDLGSGLYKARIRGEVHSSWGLKRSVQKFILYEGAILIAGGIDMLFMMCKVMKLIGVDLIHGVALFTSIIGVLLCIVEIWSLREKADEKTIKDINRAGSILGSLIDKKEFTETIGKAITDALGKDNQDEETTKDKNLG